MIQTHTQTTCTHCGLVSNCQYPGDGCHSCCKGSMRSAQDELDDAKIFEELHTWLSSRYQIIDAEVGEE